MWPRACKRSLEAYRNRILKYPTPMSCGWSTAVQYVIDARNSGSVKLWESTVNMSARILRAKCYSLCDRAQSLLGPLIDLSCRPFRYVAKVGRGRIFVPRHLDASRVNQLHSSKTTYFEAGSVFFRESLRVQSGISFKHCHCCQRLDTDRL
jgi:hypothetical protein